MSDMVNGYACGDCRWWDAQDDAHGHCRRRAPRVDLRTDQAHWPVTHIEDWCAEFNGFPVGVRHVAAPVRESEQP